jgi:hypothetical protein
VPRTGVALKPLPAHPIDTLKDFCALRGAPVEGPASARSRSR